MWGLHSKKLTIVGARTSQGKSAFALQVAWDVASQGIPTLFLSLEMYEEDLHERLFCLTQKIDNFDLLKGQFKRENIKYEQRWKEFTEEVEGVPLVITDMLGKTWEDVDKYLSTLVTKPKLIVIDHLQEAKSALNRNQKECIEEYLKQLRVMAIRENFALVVCSQINRSSQEERVGASPQLHQLKSSGYIEEGADVIILLHWPWYYNREKDKNRYVLNVAKNRNGRTGWVEVKYKPENYLFYEEVAVTEEEAIKNWQE